MTEFAPQVNWSRGLRAVVIGTFVFALIAPAAQGKVPFFIFYDDWQTVLTLLGWYAIYCSLVFWLFARKPRGETNK